MREFASSEWLIRLWLRRSDGSDGAERKKGIEKLEKLKNKKAKTNEKKKKAEIGMTSCPETSNPRRRLDDEGLKDGIGGRDGSEDEGISVQRPMTAVVASSPFRSDWTWLLRSSKKIKIKTDLTGALQARRGEERGGVRTRVRTGNQWLMIAGSFTPLLF